MTSELERCRAMIDGRLGEIIKDRLTTTSGADYTTLLESMKYSLLAGGKRMRPIICLKFCEAAGGDTESALDAACAIEMMHTYTLIHDDLPCMDNSEMRRGMPSNHVKFGEFAATLAGDALQAASFETLARSRLPAAAVVEMVKILTQACGPHGICGGQYLDMRSEIQGEMQDEMQGECSPPAEGLLFELNRMKTAVLISAAAQIGVLAAGGPLEQIKAAEDYALALGVAFQVRDDVLDSTAWEKELGKPLGSDIVNNKVTCATLLGIDKCEEIIARETEKAVAALEGSFDNTAFLTWLAYYLAGRRS